MPKENKFEEFYYNKNKTIVKLSTLLKYLKKHKNIQPYENNMYCPECLKAELTLIENIENPYLKKIPSSRHVDDCSYDKPTASFNMVKEYYDSLSEKQVKRKLASLMRYFFEDNVNKRITDNKGLNIEDKSKDINNSNNVSKEVRRYYTLRKKRLDTWFDVKDTNLYAFYGKVNVHISQDFKGKNSYIYHFLILDTEDEYDHTYYIFRSGSAQDDEFKNNTFYNVVLIGKFNRDKKGIMWKSKVPYDNERYMYEIKLVNKKAIVYKEC